MKRGNSLWLIAFAVACLSFSVKQANPIMIDSNVNTSHIPALQLNNNIPENFTKLSYDTNSIARVGRKYVLRGSQKKVNKATIERKNSLLQWIYILPNNIVIFDYTA